MSKERKEYMYYFTTGGWNTEFASSPEEAYEIALERWKDSPSLTPCKDSFKPVDENREEYESNMRSFW